MDLPFDTLLFRAWYLWNIFLLITFYKSNVFPNNIGIKSIFLEWVEIK